MNSNLDVWAIQHDRQELFLALDQIKEGLNIIYSNCVCDFEVGNHNLTSVKFDTILYNEESDILIILMQDGEASKEDMIEYLEQHNKRYAEIVFDKDNVLNVDNNQVKEIWFAREKAILEDAIGDSLEKNITTCDFYPLVEGKLSFSYMTNNDEKFSVDGRLFQGLIEFDDKYILITNQKNTDKNLSVNDILETFENNNISYNISLEKDIDIENKVINNKSF